MVNEKEFEQYFLNHPEYYNLISDRGFISFLTILSKRPLTEYQIVRMPKQEKNALGLLEKALGVGAVEKIKIGGLDRYVVTESGREFLEKAKKIHSGFKVE